MKNEDNENTLYDEYVYQQQTDELKKEIRPMIKWGVICWMLSICFSVLINEQHNNNKNNNLPSSSDDFIFDLQGHSKPMK